MGWPSSNGTNRSIAAAYGGFDFTTVLGMPGPRTRAPSAVTATLSSILIPPKLRKSLQPVVADEVRVPALLFPLVHQRRDEVDARLDRQDETRLEATNQPQEVAPELLAPLLAARVADDVPQVFHVVHIKTQHVPEAVGKEQGMGACGHRIGGIAFHQAHPAQAVGDDPRGVHVDIDVGHAGPDHPDRSQLRPQHRFIHLRLDGGEAPAHRRGPRDVGGIEPRRLDSRIVEQQLSLLEHMVVGMIVQDLAVNGHDRGEGLLPAGCEGDTLHHSRDLVFATARPRRGHRHAVHPVRHRAARPRSRQSQHPP